jgi:hypothetical protein
MFRFGRLRFGRLRFGRLRFGLGKLASCGLIFSAAAVTVFTDCDTRSCPLRAAASTWS